MPTLPFPARRRGVSSCWSGASQLDEELDNMLDSWCRIMLDFVADPGVTSSFELLETEQKRAVKKFQARES